MKKRLIAISAALLLLIGPVWAVFKEDNLNHTLSVLLMELKETYSGLLQFSGTAEKRIQEQHQRLVELVDECNELSVMLYSQASENTFDLTFALNEVTSQYEQFKGQSTPYAEVKENIITQMDRYSRLVFTLRKMPPERTEKDVEQETQIAMALDSAAVVFALSDTTSLVNTPDFVKDEFKVEMDEATTQVRDSCLHVAEQIVAYYWLQLQQIEKDNEYYNQTDELLRGAYTYAQEQYASVQRKLFVEGQGNYFKTLRNLPRRMSKAREDIRSRYSLQLGQEDNVVSSWRGPIVFIYSFMLLFILLLATLVSTLVVNKGLMKSSLGQSQWFKDHKGLIIALLGVLLFSIFLFINAATSRNTFIIRSSRMMEELARLIAAIFTSMLIRLDKYQIRCTVRAYLPTLIMAFIIIYIRIIFLPNSVIRLVFPALLLLFTIWQYWVNIKMLSGVDRRDRILVWGSAIAMTVATLISWAGVVMGSLMFLIGWMFLLALLEAIFALSELLDRYYETRIIKRKIEYRSQHPAMPLTSAQGAYIEVTWLHDLLKMTVIRLLIIWSFPTAIFMACNVFNFIKVAENIFFTPFIQDQKGFQLSVFMVVTVISLFYVFRYLVYASKAVFRALKTKALIRKLGDNVVFKETDINFNLANNIIGLLGWGLYIVTVFLLLKIPASGLALVSTGLATGVGFAMKDILNNFFYGIQLMSGRVRVGDIVECDGIRGTVVGLSYQTTKLETADGAVIFFTNSALFSKNFRSLTRNDMYQLVTLDVGVKYGTSIEEARQIITDALTPLMIKDKYGRDVVDKRYGVVVRLLEFGESSVNLQVRINITVDSFGIFQAQAREAIYKAFNEKGIEIPFPQVDVHVKDTPESHA